MNSAAASWQPIETAPRDGTFFVIFTHGEYEVGRYAPSFWASFEDAGNGYYKKVDRHMTDWSGFNNFHAATHWMPLPPPPKE